MPWGRTYLIAGYEKVRVKKSMNTIYSFSIQGTLNKLNFQLTKRTWHRVVWAKSSGLEKHCKNEISKARTETRSFYGNL